MRNARQFFVGVLAATILTLSTGIYANWSEHYGHGHLVSYIEVHSSNYQSGDVVIRLKDFYCNGSDVEGVAIGGSEPEFRIKGTISTDDVARMLSILTAAKLSQTVVRLGFSVNSNGECAVYGVGM